MASYSQPAIIWPAKFLPGTTDNFVTNETYAKGVTAAQIWGLLADISKWASYYDNVAQITPPASGPLLDKGDDFSFSTFGFPAMAAHVEESVAPAPCAAGRLAWSCKLDGDADTFVEVYHAWLVEDVEGGRVRILTQESQSGRPAAQLGALKPNRMLLGHQDWIEGLVAAARGGKLPDTNLGSIKGL